MGISEDFQSSITPLIVFFLSCNVVGFFGNIAVLYVYGWRYKRNRYRLLVLALSITDMSACCTTVPMETVSSWLWFDAPSTALCKSKMFFIMFIGLAAMYMLFVTAVYKYRRICKPFGKQVSQKVIISLCVFGWSISFIYGIPAAILFDVNFHKVTLNNVTEDAFICEAHSSFHGTPFPAAYRHCVSAYCILMVTTIILYIFVARKTILHVRQIKKLPQLSIPSTVSESSFSTVSLPSEAITGQLNHLESRSFNTHKQGNDLKGTASNLANTASSEKTDETKDSEKEPQARTTVAKLRLTSSQIRKVIIMVIIAGTFSVTFLMGLTFGYIFAIRDYTDYSSVEELLVLFACYRLYFINYALNPVIYFSLDRQFRREVFKVFEHIKSRFRM